MDARLILQNQQQQSSCRYMTTAAAMALQLQVHWKLQEATMTKRFGHFEHYAGVLRRIFELIVKAK